jgi:hypothetical protein
LGVAVLISKLIVYLIVPMRPFPDGVMIPLSIKVRSERLTVRAVTLQ